MIEIKRITDKKEFKKFVRFPNWLYRNNPNYVPPFELDEINLMNPKKNASFEDSDAAYFLAYKDGEMVGRIAGIICHLYNQKNDSKRARFSRYECTDDDEVAKKLLTAVEDWAKENGMEEVHGPLGFNDLEREGLLVDGFEHPGIYFTSYNLPYYQKQIEDSGYVPETRWYEWKLTMPEDPTKLSKFYKVADIVEKRYGFYEKKFKNIHEIVKGYGKAIFKLLDECFEPIYGTMPFSEKVVDQTIKMFELSLDKDYISLVFSKEDELVGFGFGMASLADALRKSKGRYLPFGIFRILNAIKHPKAIELGLIGVLPKYQNTGVTAIIFKNMIERIRKNGIKTCYSGVQLESNLSIHKIFESFNRELLRTKLCYVKSLVPGKAPVIKEKMTIEHGSKYDVGKGI